jgi:hypothetical protein
MTLPELLEWFSDRADLPPRKMHQRGVWVDPRDHAGSALGSPDWTAAWTRWLHAPPHATQVEQYEDRCYHAGVVPGQRCPSCTVYREDGTVLYSTGIVKRTRVRYRWPMRLVLHRLWKTPDRPGRPNMASVLWQLLVADFDMARAASALSTKWPQMAEPATARAVFYLALRKAHRLYREDVDIPLTRRGGHKPKSDSQLDAEAQAVRPSHDLSDAL